MLDQFFVFVVSFLANTLSSLAGGGAGLLQLPALIFLGLPFNVALATHKIASVALGLGASVKYLKQNHFRWQFVTIMIAGALPGVVIGAKIILLIPSYIALLLLGVLTISLGIYSICKPNLGVKEQFKNTHITGYFIGAIGLFIIGVLNGSLTSGTGLFVTMWLVYWFGMGYSRAVSYTLVLVGVLWNGTGALTLALETQVQWTWLPVLVLGSFLGGYAGAHIAIKNGNALVKRAFEIMTILTGISLIYKVINPPV